MQLIPCQCDPEMLIRIQRWFWMRWLFPSRRRYYCQICQRKMLIKPPVGGRHDTPQQAPETVTRP